MQTSVLDGTKRAMLDLKEILANPDRFLWSMARRGYPQADQVLKELVELVEERKKAIQRIEELQVQEKLLRAKLTRIVRDKE